MQVIQDSSNHVNRQLNHSYCSIEQSTGDCRCTLEGLATSYMSLPTRGTQWANMLSPHLKEPYYTASVTWYLSHGIYFMDHGDQSVLRKKLCEG